MVEWNGLENRRGASHPGFESLSLRQLKYEASFTKLFVELRICLRIRKEGSAKQNSNAMNKSI